MPLPPGRVRRRTHTSLCILITNAFLRDWTGSELYVQDLATQLISRGHKPVVYSPRLGRLADALRQKSIPVVDDLASIAVTPDLIHGQHHVETMTALTRYPRTPAVFFCHGWLPWDEAPPIHPRLLKYVVVSDALRDRLIHECGISAGKITTILNSVDLEKFRPRPPLPAAPRRALVFNSHINETNVLGLIREACDTRGIELDALGYAAATPSSNPEAQIGRYDLIFAHGRAALEALAVGAAVVCLGLEGTGPMVTTENLRRLRRNNLGIRVHSGPFSVEALSAEIQRYDARDAAAVCAKVRAGAGLDEMVDQILGVYHAALSAWKGKRKIDAAADNAAVSAYLQGISDRVHELAGERSRVSLLEAESRHAHERISLLEAERAQLQGSATALQEELARMRGSSTWRLREALIKVPIVGAALRNLVAVFRPRSSSQKTDRAH